MVEIMKFTVISVLLTSQSCLPYITAQIAYCCK